MNDKIEHAKKVIGKTILNAIENSDFQLKKKDIANKADVSMTHMYAIINGNGNYTIEALIRVCIAAEVDFLSLIDEIKYKQVPQKEKDEIIKVLEEIKDMTYESSMNVSMINNKVCELIDKYL